jgi:tRNA threonylcarbamoyladenosine biosynthesis protein TsaB
VKPVLGIDSAGAGLSVAIVRGDEVLAWRDEAMERGQAERLMPAIATVLDEAGIATPDLGLIGVTVGPGSFTGLRVGIAAARGLALAAGVRAIGISSFAAVAAQVPAAERDGRSLVVTLDTRRDDFYVECRDEHDRPLGEPRLLAVGDAHAVLPPGPLLLAGDAAARLAPHLGAPATLSIVTRARAEDIARLALHRLRDGTPALPPVPFYLRPPDTTMPRNAR